MWWIHNSKNRHILLSVLGVNSNIPWKGEKSNFCLDQCKQIRIIPLPEMSLSPYLLSYEKQIFLFSNLIIVPGHAISILDFSNKKKQTFFNVKPKLTKQEWITCKKRRKDQTKKFIWCIHCIRSENWHSNDMTRKQHDKINHAILVHLRCS